MRILPKPIDPDASFEKSDLFKRKPMADSLTNLALHVEDSIVCAIEGGWGTGKTSFLHMWKNALREQGVPVIFFDAFLNDHYDDPLIPLAGEVFEIAQTLAADSPELNDWLRVAGRFLKRLGKATTVLVVKGIAEASGLGKVTEAIGHSAAEAFSTPVDDLISEYGSKKQEIEEFRKTLKLLSERMSRTKEGDGNSRKKLPLVIIVDELDRCRPDFALSLLERVKHLFEVDGVHFFFGVNFPQLRNMVRTRYGDGSKNSGYLEKFFNLFVSSEKLASGQSTSDTREFIGSLISGYFGGANVDAARAVSESLQFFAHQNDLSLRQIERVSSIILIGASLIKDNSGLGSFLVGASVLKVLYPEMFRLLCRNEVSFIWFRDNVIGEFKRRDLEGNNVLFAQQKHSLALDSWRFLLDDGFETTDHETFRKMERRYPSRSTIMDYIRSLEIFRTNETD